MFAEIPQEAESSRERHRTPMKRILQISNYYPPDIGGIESIAGSISDAVQGIYEMRILCFSHENRCHTDSVKDVPVVRCSTQVKLFSQQLSARMPGLMKDAFRSYMPDCVILHMPNPFLAVLTLHYLPAGTKLIVYWHSDIVKQKTGEKIFRPLLFRLLKRADAVIATSPNYVEGSPYLQKYAAKCTVIPNCIDERSLIPSAASSALSIKLREKYPGKILCVALGHHAEYKGFIYLIRALKLLDDRFVLFLPGRYGEATPEIRKEAEGMTNVFLPGEVQPDERNGYLEACDIFCFPSVTKNEAFGIALAESMYCGKPAVTFTLPGSGVNYVNQDRVTGLEVPSRDVEAYAAALQELAADPSLRESLGKNAAERVRENFLFTQYIGNILRLLGRLL